MKSSRITYKTISCSDVDGLVDLYTNPNTRKYLGGHLDDISARKKASELVLNRPSSVWALRDLKDNFLGIIELDKYHDSDDVEISYQFLPSFWGNGYAQEALNLLMKYSFEHLKLEKLIAETQAANKKSVKLLKVLGFRKTQEIIRFGEKQIVFEFTHKNES